MHNSELNGDNATLPRRSPRATPRATKIGSVKDSCYSPDFNPIENAFAKLKALLRKAAERTCDGLWSTIDLVIDLFRPRRMPKQSLLLGMIQSDRKML